MYTVSWGFDGETGEVTIGIEDIEMRPCLESDLDHFHEFDSGGSAFVKAQWGLLHCVESVQDLSFTGAYRMSRGRIVVADVKPCSGDGCKTDEEIEDFVKSSMIVLMVNNQQYLPEEYSDQVIVNQLEMRNFDFQAQQGNARRFPI